MIMLAKAVIELKKKLMMNQSTVAYKNASYITIGSIVLQTDA